MDDGALFVGKEEKSASTSVSRCFGGKRRWIQQQQRNSKKNKNKKMNLVVSLPATGNYYMLRCTNLWTHCEQKLSGLYLDDERLQSHYLKLFFKMHFYHTDTYINCINTYPIHTFTLLFVCVANAWELLVRRITAREYALFLFFFHSALLFSYLNPTKKREN